MNAFFSKENNLETEISLSNELKDKVSNALNKQVYMQAPTALAASLFCAMIVFIGCYSLPYVWLWFGCYLAGSILRTLLVFYYKHTKVKDRPFSFWQRLYLLGSVVGGLSWGLVAVLLLPAATPVQQILIVLMLAGVTGGAVPLASVSYSGTVAFLLCSLIPFIISFALFKNNVYLLFDSALTVYLIYSIAVATKNHRVIRNAILLKFEKDILLNQLSVAKIQLEISNQKLQHAATHDALTEVANRNLFHVNFNNAIKKAQSKGKRVALLYMDLDRFKLVNDAYGHEIGDKLLSAIVQRLVGFFRTEQVISRLGGDEITLILENIDTLETIETISTKLCQLMRKSIQINNIELTISASIGISIYPDDGRDEATLLWHADKAMYFVKEHGGNNFAFFQELKETQT